MTGRLRQLEELLAPLERLEALTEANPDAVLTLSGEEILYANPAAQALLRDLQGPLSRQVLLVTAANRRSKVPERTTVALGERHFDISAHSAGELQQVTLRRSEPGEACPETFAHRVNNLITGLLGLSVLLEDQLAGGENAELASELRTTAQAVAATLRTPEQQQKSSATGNGKLRAWTPGRVGEGETILFVDDEQSIRLVGKATLTRAGYRVLTARNGEDAVQLYRRHGEEIRLVLLDLEMPIVNGEACFEALRALRPAPRVIVMSGHEKAPAIGRMLEKGALDFLAKPFGVNELLAAVEHWLQPAAAR